MAVLASIFLFIVIIAQFYNHSREKLRHLSKMEAMQQEIDIKNSELEELVREKNQLTGEKDGLLKAKAWLEKEIHHRVKNNLQMVISLLNAQSEFLQNPSALTAVRESMERMQALAILHQKLYQTGISNIINMPVYIRELVDNISSNIDDSERIHFDVKIENINLDIAQAAPLGLILNEGITNAIKYAYPKRKKGGIQVSLRYTGNRQVQLRIADYGKGLPPGADVEDTNSLGLQLIRLFSEQLEGELFFLNNNGLEIILNFRIADYTNSSDENINSVPAN
jgi:two-component sensor histidine kinase